MGDSTKVLPADDVRFHFSPRHKKPLVTRSIASRGSLAPASRNISTVRIPEYLPIVWHPLKKKKKYNGSSDVCCGCIVDRVLFDGFINFKKRWMYRAQDRYEHRQEAMINDFARCP
jgi:hypothetical protein